ncbi:MAG: glucosamine-fructose-6-phosphate aminotransferase [Edafosvirus sp.]|uniref:Glutamine--fructose-6-phosphate aminotransferase [isomerizing] n=1 Tax=Edafosvirus sp. TaxID=2487765 RepID=A0A3G4ZUG0_9VIRU|nr:MAG: glucosamine-fructose-6-phosphate aminotransferase [Edafosvirus sp.]
MCGIVGYLGNCKCFNYIINGLEILQNRGYDSIGICSIYEKKLFLNKYASCESVNAITKLKTEEKYHQGFIGIGHTRWSTHGGKTDKNAHPHVDHKNKISLVHNGIIENYEELKQELITKHNVEFKSETDSEVIVNLISVLYDQYGDLVIAIKKALLRLEGSWALGIICVDTPNNLYCVTKGCPLLIGYGDNFMMIASEQNGFPSNVEKYICLNDNDFHVIEKNDTKFIFDDSGYKINKINRSVDQFTKSILYPHWTIKEINEQPISSLKSIITGLKIKEHLENKISLDDDKYKINLPNLDLNIKKYINAKHLILLGCGTSFYAGLHGSNFFKDIADFETVQVIDGGEFTKKDIPTSGQTLFIILSQSGETKDLHKCITIAKEYSIFTIGVVNVVDSRIARDVDSVCYLNCGPEIGVASTKSFTSQIIVLSMIALWYAQNKNIHKKKRCQYIDELIKLPKDISQTIKSSEKICEKIAEFFVDKTSCFILGKGWCESIAKEGSLKIKEIGYIHAEGYSAVALKHGPFSLLQENTPVIFVNPDDEDNSRVNNSIEEVHSRGTPIILITDKLIDKLLSKKLNNIIVVPKNIMFKGIIHTIPMQLIAYYLAIYKKINPDMPRNLAKCITVD